MSQRLYAALLAVPLLFGLVVAAVMLPLPYVTFAPGITVDVLGEEDGEEIIQVEGARTYHTDGQLRMTTVYVTQPGGRVTLFEAMDAWLSDEQAIYPYDAVYGPDETAEDSRAESAVQMVTSQDAATAVALKELGYDVETVTRVLDVREGLPAEGKLEVHDILLRVGDRKIASAQDVVDAVEQAPEGEPIEFVFKRDGKRMTTEITPEMVDGKPRVGITPGPSYDFPFDVTVNIEPGIGGPSAGLMFSLGIYDTLTPGSLTGGEIVAGTGTIDAEGKVGPIGGIQQKVVAARDAGAELFLVPADNCAAALGAPNGDVTLVRADTMPEALDAVQAWTADHDADLPTCTADAA
jgi:PDZ domain-containing protein